MGSQSPVNIAANACYLSKGGKQNPLLYYFLFHLLPSHAGTIEQIILL